MRFELVTMDGRGALATRVVDAGSAEAARALLGARERLVGLRKLGEGRPAAGLRRDLLAFGEALDQVLAGGLSLTEGLGALAAEQGSRPASIAQAVLSRLDLGRSPADAFEATGLPWSPFFIALLRSGERNGRLPDAVARFVTFERSMLALRGRLLSASMYPLVLLGVSMLVVLFLLGFVVPKFAMALDDLRDRMPAASRLVIDAGVAIGDHLGAIGAGLVAGVLLMGVAWQALPMARLGTALAARMPLLRDVVKLADRAQTLRVASAVLGGGDTLSSALVTARRTAGPSTAPQLEATLAAVENGARPSRALGDSGLLGPTATQLVRAAERTGRLPECFERLALADEATLASTLERMTTVYGPVLLLAIAMVVGGVVLALYWPLLQLFESVR